MSEQIIVQVFENPIQEERVRIVLEEQRNIVQIEEEGIRIIQTGTQGPPGAGLPVNLLAKLQTYVHRQDIPAAVWNINHNLDVYPSVSVVDSTDSIVIGEIQYINKNSVVVTFNGSFSGKAYLN